MFGKIEARAEILKLVDERIKANDLKFADKIILIEQRNRVAKLFGMKEIGLSILKP